jgi:hypothetical protein
MIADRRTSIGIAQSGSRAFGEANVLCFSAAAEFIQGANGLLEGGVFSCRLEYFLEAFFLFFFVFFFNTYWDQFCGDSRDQE